MVTGSTELRPVDLPDIFHQSIAAAEQDEYVEQYYHLKARILSHIHLPGYRQLFGIMMDQMHANFLTEKDIPISCSSEVLRNLAKSYCRFVKQFLKADCPRIQQSLVDEFMNSLVRQGILEITWEG